MAQSTENPLRFEPFDGLTVRADFNGGAMTSDIGPLMPRSVDRQIGLTDRLAQAADDRHPSYISHSTTDLIAQRVYPIAIAYEEGNDANGLRYDPVFQMGLGRRPLAETSELASGATLSRLENAASSKGAYRLAMAFVDPFLASYPEPPEAIVLDMDHTDDATTHGQQALSFYNPHYNGFCFLPLLLFEGLSGKFIMAALRLGKRPSGAENALILKRVLRRIRQAWPDTHILLRGDGHFANPELMALTERDPNLDFLFGLAGNSRLNRLAESYLEANRERHAACCAEAHRVGGVPPVAIRTWQAPRPQLA